MRYLITRTLALTMLSTNTGAKPLPELPLGPSPDRIREAWEIPLLSPWQYTTLCIGISLLGLWLIVLFIRRLRTKENPINRFNPYESTLNELNALKSEQNSAQLGEKIIYTLCQFFEASLEVKAHGRSFCAIAQQLDLNKIDNEQLIVLWKDCEHAKFGHASIDKCRRIELINTCIAIVHAAHANNREEED